MAQKEIREFFDTLADGWDRGNQPLGEVTVRLLRLLGIKEGDEILDLACGRGVITGALHDLSKAPVLGVDLSPKMIEGAKEDYRGKAGVEFRCLDFLSEDLGKKFDYVVCYNAFPHFLDASEFARRVASTLKEGGRFAILHSFGMKGLNEHHKHTAGTVSRMLKKPSEEQKAFEPYFEILLSESEDDHYAILGRLK